MSIMEYHGLYVMSMQNRLTTSMKSTSVELSHVLQASSVAAMSASTLVVMVSGLRYSCSVYA